MLLLLCCSCNGQKPHLDERVWHKQPAGSLKSSCLNDLKRKEKHMEMLSLSSFLCMFRTYSCLFKTSTQPPVLFYWWIQSTLFVVIFILKSWGVDCKKILLHVYISISSFPSPFSFLSFLTVTFAWASVSFSSSWPSAFGKRTCCCTEQVDDE